MSMKYISSTVILAAALSFSQTTLAGPNPYKDCGIGAALFSNTSWAAVTSNVIWDLGSTAITSATASPETCNGTNVQAAIFIKDTYESLAEETAKGEGEHLATLLNIYSCSTQARPSIIGEIRTNMSQNVSSSAYDSTSHMDKASNYYSIVNTAVASKCTA